MAEAAASTYLAHARSVLHLVDSPQETGWGGGGEVCRIPLKLVAKRGASATDGVEGRCFFFLDDRFNFWAALHRDSKEEKVV